MTLRTVKIPLVVLFCIGSDGSREFLRMEWMHFEQSWIDHELTFRMN